MRKALIFAAVLAVGVGTAGTALAVSGGSSPVYSGCIAGKTRALVNVHKASSVKCSKGETEISWNRTGPAGPKGATGRRGPAGTAGKPYQPVEASAVFTLNGRDDSGNGGNWAKDDITRTVTVLRQGAVPVSDCGGAATACYFYTETISDTGTFTTDAEASTPNQACTEPGGQSCDGLKISGTVVGSISGGGDEEFYADQATPAAPKTLSYTGNGPTDTTDWYKLFFPADTIFGSPSGSAAGDPWTTWSWSYAAPSTCETWTDAYNNGDGNGTYAADGNIAGLNQC
ncbi:MAG TPA: hypothetical protein VMA95_14110 [Streptosporangiaceae bacterium]|nr:hypothetical protein [Streptosporangiaceae bacterium]